MWNKWRQLQIGIKVVFMSQIVQQCDYRGDRSSCIEWIIQFLNIY